MEQIGDLIYASSDAGVRVYDADGNEVDHNINGSRDVIRVGRAIATISTSRISLYSQSRELRRTLEVPGYWMHQAVRLEGDPEFVLAVAAEERFPETGQARILKFRMDGSFEVLEIAGDFTTGLYQLPEGGDLLVSTSDGVQQYHVDGTSVRSLLGGPFNPENGLMYFGRIDNFAF